MMRSVSQSETNDRLEVLDSAIASVLGPPRLQIVPQVAP